MITDLILDLLCGTIFTIIDQASDLIYSFDLPSFTQIVSMMDYGIDYVSPILNGCAYFLPIQNLLPLFLIWFILWGFRTAVSLAKLIIEFVPFF